MKKAILISFLCFIFSLSFFSGNARASVLSDFSLNDVSENVLEPWRRFQFDKLALDIVIPANDGNGDSLNALSIMNLQSAYYKKGIEKLVLWTDEKTAGFQGMGVDNKIGDAIWDGNSSTWYWSDLSVVVPAEGLRIFVSVEMENDIDDNRTVQLVIPKFTDNNDNGSFDFEDKGVFMSSKNNGPTDQELKNISMQTIRSGTRDVEGPKSVITNLFDGDEIELGDSFVMSGLSKDQGNRSVNFVQISIAKEGADDDWKDVSTDKYDFADWSYVWQPTEIGNYEIKIKSRDLGESESITDAMIISVIEKDDEVPPEEDKKEEGESISINDGDIIQCQSSGNPFAVYIVKVVGDTKYIRHIVSLEIFNYYGHLKWENLKQVDSLDNYSLSGWARVNTGPDGTAGPNDKVYEINADQSKHWINMTAEDFLTHGGSEPAIYNINQGELNLYTTGVDVMSL